MPSVIKKLIKEHINHFPQGALPCLHPEHLHPVSTQALDPQSRARPSSAISASSSEITSTNQTLTWLFNKKESERKFIYQNNIMKYDIYIVPQNEKLQNRRGICLYVSIRISQAGFLQSNHGHAVIHLYKMICTRRLLQKSQGLK